MQNPHNFTVPQLIEMSKELRRDIVKMVHAAGSGHPGGSLSAVELMAVLYFSVMHYDPKDVSNPERDYFILSKGHVTPIYYSALAEAGFFDKEILWTFRNLGSPLQGHPGKGKVPGIEVGAGSLGQGLSIASGVALATKVNHKENKVFCLLGDGELQEGQIWEAIMTAAHYKLDNLIALVDYNNLQIDGTCEEVMGIAPLKEKWEAFNWHVVECDGHDIEDVLRAYAKATSFVGKPSVIIAKTHKGKGISYMEDVAGWHGKAPSDEELKLALEELA